MRKHSGRAVVLGLFLVIAPSAWAVSTYTCSAIPVSAGTSQPSYLFPTSINNQHHLAGTWFFPVTGFAVDTQGMNIPYTSPSGQTVRQLAVNNLGQVAGWYGDPGGGPPVVSAQGFISNPDGSLMILDLPPNTASETFHDNWIHSINDNGDIFGEIAATEQDGSLAQYWYVRNAVGAYALFDKHNFVPFDYYASFQTVPKVPTGSINNSGTAVFPSGPFTSQMRFADGSEKAIAFRGSASFPWLFYGINNNGYVVGNFPKLPYYPPFSVLVSPDGHAPAIVCPGVEQLVAFSVNDNGVIGAEGQGQALLATPTGWHSEVQLSNQSWGFSPNPVGAEGGSGTIYLSSTGAADLHIQAVTGIPWQGGNSSSDFTIRNDTTCIGNNGFGGPVPKTFAPGEFCTISFTFKPAGVGARRAEIEVWDDAPDAPHIIPLDGTGLGKDNLVLSNTSWNLGTFPAGQTSPPGTIFIYNPGTDPINISGIEITGANASDVQISSNTCGAAFAPFRTCAISFVFTPGAPGFRTAAVTIGSDSPTNPQSIPMTGYGY